MFRVACCHKGFEKKDLPLMPGAVGANLCVRPIVPGKHAGLPLHPAPKKGVLFCEEFLCG
ncbi:hypothetical protein KKHLCK_07920 [Candidatus Electrothrix laxa]